MMSTPRKMLSALILTLAIGAMVTACTKDAESDEANEGAMTAGQTTATAEKETGEANEGAEGNEAAEESAEALAKEAKIAEADARKTALAQVPGGMVEAFELEREGGKLLYSYDIKTTGKSGIDEVQIDALTGALLSNKHETPADEAKEAAEDAAAKT
ncbi:MAG TPA: PepSY domain-containing protein [Gemmatimonadales bacterium]|nr:PepSY domain-containing protein [Gemmatimonadales bacterium]